MAEKPIRFVTQGMPAGICGGDNLNALTIWIEPLLEKKSWIYAERNMSQTVSFFAN